MLADKKILSNVPTTQMIQPSRVDGKEEITRILRKFIRIGEVCGLCFWKELP